MKTQDDWDRHWMKLTFENSKLSKDPKTKVGACIVSKDNRQVSFGYNGFPKGIEETPEKWERPLKYEYVIHAEINAIINCPFETIGCSIYLTIAPCHKCIGCLLNAGIERIVFNDVYKNQCYQDIWDEVASQFSEVKMLGMEF